MVKVLIVDDELLVRVGLKSTLQWEDNGFLLVGEARNASEAIDLFEKRNPDILLTDICMPGASGLELIETLRRRKPELRSIILTHHEDFGFAKQAISLGASEYILKSDLTPERLLAALEDARRSMSPRGPESYAANDGDAGEKRETDKRFLELLGEEHPLSGSREEALRYFASILPADSFLVGSVMIQWKYADGAAFDAKLRRAIEDVCDQIIPEGQLTHYRIVMESRILYLFNFDGERNGGAAVEDKILVFMNRLMSNIKKFFNLYLTIGVSGAGDGLESVPELYAQARAAQDAAFFEPSHVGVHGGLRSSVAGPGFVPDRRRIDRLIAARLRDQLEEYLEESLAAVFAAKDYPGLQALAEQLVGAADASDGSLRVFNGIVGLYDFESVRRYLSDVLDSIFEKDDSGENVRNSFIIKKSVRYIQDHFSENISLSSLASHVEVSRSYLSFLFKQELGVNFSHYLINTRIENAKRLLVESNMKIYEIADNVGFDSPYYFSKVFKEITGKPCKEYRSEFYAT